MGKLLLLSKSKDLIGVFLEKLGLKKTVVEFIIYNKAALYLLFVYNKITKKNVSLSIILWPPVSKYFDEIESDLLNFYEITSKIEFNVAENEFETFVKRIYAIDNASNYKINYKLNYLVRPPLQMRVLDILIRKPKMKPQDIFNNTRCLEIAELKILIRKKYCNLISDYKHDIIIHSTENEAQTKLFRRLINEYEKCHD